MATGREMELFQHILDGFVWGASHPFVTEIEQKFAAFQHCAHGVSAANGTVAIELALAAAGIGPGDEVIVPAISFIATATAVSRIGAIPVFCDIEELSFNLDPARAEAAISPRTRAIIPVHFGGQMAEMDALLDLAARHNLVLMEDAAHAHGSEWRGRRAGSLGLCGTFSFQNSKVMTAGEGGMVTSNDPALADLSRSLANQGRNAGGGWFHHYRLGTNYRINAFTAAVLLAQLEALPAQIALRNRNAALLYDELRDVRGLRLQLAPQAPTVNSFYLLLGRVDPARRNAFCSTLNAHGVPAAAYYPHTLYRNPLYESEPCRVTPCPVAEATITDAFWLPQRALMGDEASTREIAALVRQALA